MPKQKDPNREEQRSGSLARPRVIWCRRAVGAAGSMEPARLTIADYSVAEQLRDVATKVGDERSLGQFMVPVLPRLFMRLGQFLFAQQLRRGANSGSDWHTACFAAIDDR